MDDENWDDYIQIDDDDDDSDYEPNASFQSTSSEREQGHSSHQQTSYKDKPPSKRTTSKVEIKNICLSSEVKDRIMSTLRSIHGTNFIVDSEIPVINRKKLSNRFWMDQGQLVVRNCYNYSNKSDLREHVNTFALENLEKYGFYTNHCREALLKMNNSFQEALQALLSFYFRVNLGYVANTVTVENISDKEEEISALKSIYENMCEEKTKNKHWAFHLDLPYLAKWYFKERYGASTRAAPKHYGGRRRQLCRFFSANGTCRFGNNCRFLHENPAKDSKTSGIESAEKKLMDSFLLEMRFPDVCDYPNDLPLITFTSKHLDFSKNVALRVTKLLYEEAKNCSKSGSPYAYDLISKLIIGSDSVIEYLDNESESKLNLSPEIPLYPALSSEKASTSSQPTVKHTDKKLCVDRRSENKSFSDADLISMMKFKLKNHRYLKMKNHRQKLPAWNSQDQILRCLEYNQVVVIVGETGCGKSTQIPQFILDEWLESVAGISNRRTKWESVEIICTQPRRLSTIGVASRVAEERLEELGECVGYQIRLESRSSQRTKLLFCTIGILLRRLESDPLLAAVTHIIVDEVHERSEESDFLLLILKDLLKYRKDLKVILMSATLNAELFSKYFNGAPLIEIPGKMFPVHELYLEDILTLTDYTIDEYSRTTRKITKGMTNQLDRLACSSDLADVMCNETFSRDSVSDECLTARQLFYRYRDYSLKTRRSILLMNTEIIDPQLILATLKWVVEGDHEYPKEGSILVFLPGLADIISVHDELTGDPFFGSKYGSFRIIPLHSTISNEEQSQIFNTVRGVRKIVLSTNIAETSITIDDCVFVIDTGKMKETRFDTNKNMTSLETVWVSKANARQRKGRAGRVMSGLCIRLYTKHRFDYIFDSQPIPEIKRAALDQIILRLKTLNTFKTKTPTEVLTNLMEPPTDVNILTAMERLRDVGALDQENELTPLGRHLAALPVDVKIGKLILFGAIFCCIDPILTIAASLSDKSPFVSPFNKRDTAQARKKKLTVNNSDHLTVLKAYTDWYSLTSRRDRARRYAEENFLSWRTLERMCDLKHQYLELLVNIGFINVDVGVRRRRHEDLVLKITSNELNQNAKDYRLLSGIICAALYPNLVEILTPEKQYIHSAAGAIPRNYQADELKFLTKRDGYVALHPSSVNHDVANFTSPYLVFQEKMKTSRIFIHDSTMVSIMSLVLFAGTDFSIECCSGINTISVEDGWLVFTVNSVEEAKMLHHLRVEFLKLFDKKIQDPSLDLTADNTGKMIISTISYVLSQCI